MIIKCQKCDIQMILNNVDPEDYSCEYECPKCHKVIWK